MTLEPVVDLVIAVHDASRPVERAIDSVLAEPVPVRITVVCHGISSESLNLSSRIVADERVRTVEFADGIPSPAGPFNRGLDLASAPYVGVMGSDDFLEPGAMKDWIRRVSAGAPDVLIAGLRHQDGTVLRNPLVRFGRRRGLSASRDRLFYRVAPLGLIRRDFLESLRLRFTEGLRTGEDLAVSARLWASASRVDFAGTDRCYVIGADADSRVTLAVMSVEEVLAPVADLVNRDWLRTVPHAVRQSLGVALLRNNVIAAMLARPLAAMWEPGDVTVAQRCLADIRSLAPRSLVPLARADRSLLDVLGADDVSLERMIEAVERHAVSTRSQQLLTRSPLRLFDRESVPVRYLLYALEEWADQLRRLWMRTTRSESPT